MGCVAIKREQWVIAGVITAGVVYGSGPNIIVGAAGILYSGGSAIRDKVTKAFLERKLAREANPYDNYYLKDRIALLNESQRMNLRFCSYFAWSMIPFAGPFIAVAKAV